MQNQAAFLNSQSGQLFFQKVDERLRPGGQQFVGGECINRHGACLPAWQQRLQTALRRIWSGQRVRQRCDAKTVQRQAQVQSQAVGSNAAIHADAA